MNWISYIFNHRLLLHVLYWLGVFFFFCLYGLGHNQPIKVSLYVIAVDFPVQIIAFYSLLYFQLPLLFQRKYISFTWLSILLGYIFYLLVHFNHDYGIGTYLISWHTQHQVWEIFAGKEVLFRNLVDIYIVVFITGAIKFIKSHLDSRQAIEELQVEVAKVNFNTLKSQLNTHFVLDTLQLIITQSKNKEDKTAETISLLSRIMDDALYQSNKEKRPLIDEAAQLGPYLTIAMQIYPWLSVHSFEIGHISRTTQIKSLIIRRVFEIVFREFSKIPNLKERFDIVILEEGEYCIIQFNIPSYTGDEIKFDELREFLTTQYPKKSYVNTLSSEAELNLAIKLIL